METDTEEKNACETNVPSSPVYDADSQVMDTQPPVNGTSITETVNLADSKLDNNEIEPEDEFEIVSELSFLKDTSLTSSPSENFKSSYAKSLADSYRRASLPVVVSAPKGQFYFKNDEVITLNRYLSLNTSASTTPSLQSFEPVSLPTTLNNVPGCQQQPLTSRSCDSISSESLKNFVCDDVPIFVPYEKINKFYGKNGEPYMLSDELVTTCDGRKLVKLSGFHELWKRKLLISPQNGETRSNGSDKDAHAEGVRLECIQLESRIQQLCEVLADRDSTIQRLEEDLLRMRMECQRLMVDNRSLKSTVSPTGGQQTGIDLGCELSVHKLKQHVELLNAQLDKAERSRRTYETATRQLVDFLHTVNTTLSSSSTNLSTTSAHTGASLKNVAQNFASEESNHGFGPVRRSPEVVQRAESVYALPTITGNRPRVNRSVSTYCVASVSASKESPTSGGRIMNSEFLVTRAKELIASLKALTRNENVMKLNMEPKKVGGSAVNSSGISTSLRKEGSIINNQSSTASHQIQINSEEGAGIGAETMLRPQGPGPMNLNDNSQPLSLMVVGETSSKSEEHGFSSLPVNGCVSRTLNDSDQRLVWV